jgi:3-isopropylmalate/(R)-2-methylmalate dehydratase small subunit
MESFSIHTGTAVVIDLANIDTDQIIPKQFLKRIERTGFGKFLFYDWRFTPSGEKIDDFVLNDPRYAAASILIAGENFGCGSSREHAPWSLLDFGFRVVIAPSFADIFYNNSLKTGLLPLSLEPNAIAKISANTTADPLHALTIDLASQTVSDAVGFSAPFEIDPFRKHCLQNGLDDIGITLQYSEAIAKFETERRQDLTFLDFPLNA